MEPVCWRKVLTRLLEIIAEHQKGFVQILAVVGLRKVVPIILQVFLVGEVAVHFLWGLDVQHDHHEVLSLLSQHSHRVDRLGSPSLTHGQLLRLQVSHQLDLVLSHHVLMEHLDQLILDADWPQGVTVGVLEEGHIHEVVRVGASAVAVGSMFVFQRPHEAVLISYLKNEIILKECQ